MSQDFKRYKIVCICQIYNELLKGNLERFIEYLTPLVDDIVAWDDASTDGSFDYLIRHTSHVLRGKRTNFAKEMQIKKVLLENTLKLGPDFIMYLDADEVFTANTATRLQELCAYCEKKELDGLSFHKLNLWRSKSWRRIDNLYDEGWFVHLWRVTPNISYGKTRQGLHQNPYPPSIKKIERVSDVQILHYGFSSERLLAHKYLVYRAYGQRGYPLNRLIDETTMKLEKIPAALFPEGLYVDDPSPKQLTTDEALAYVEKFRVEVRENTTTPRFLFLHVWLKMFARTARGNARKMARHLPSPIYRRLRQILRRDAL